MIAMQLKYEHLLNRPYEAEAGHCFALGRDFYRDNFGIVVGDYAIPHDWNADELNLIEMFYEAEGFEKVPDWSLKTLRPADVLCVAVQSACPNHFVIYLGGNKILHQPLYQFSRDETLRDYWRMATCFVLRHPDVPDLRPEVSTIQMSEVLSARHQK